MSNFIRGRQRALTAVSPHQGNKNVLVPKRSLGGSNPALRWLPIGDQGFEVGTPRQVDFRAWLRGENAATATITVNEPYPAGFTFTDGVLDWDGTGAEATLSRVLTAVDGEWPDAISNAFDNTVVAPPPVDLISQSFTINDKNGTLDSRDPNYSGGPVNFIWEDNFESGDFRNWHNAFDGSSLVLFNQMPTYGAPPDNPPPGTTYAYTGDGQLCQIVDSPVRGAGKSVRLMVKNGVNGQDPGEDCGFGDQTDRCDLRRTQLTMQGGMEINYGAYLDRTEYWTSFSVYLPDTLNWANATEHTLYGIKPRNENGGGGYFTVNVTNGAWNISNTWDPRAAPPDGFPPWPYQFFFTGNYDGQPYPRADSWPDGLDYFPDEAESVAALQDLAGGAWHDFIWHFRFDYRSAAAVGDNSGPEGFDTFTAELNTDPATQGFFDVYIRGPSNVWRKALHIYPNTTDRGGFIFSHGIGPFMEPANGNQGGAGPKFGPYCYGSGKGFILSATDNSNFYFDNLKIGDNTVTFEDMTHDGSTYPGA